MGPEFYIPEKAEECWAEDPDMLEKAKSYGIQARKVGDSLGWSAVGNHAWIDNEIPRCVLRVCLFELEGSSLQSKNQPQHSQSARDLRFYLMNSRVDQSSSEMQKRLIILEDIDPRFAELLGVMLEIPPAFFISHYHRDINLSILDRTYAQTKNSKCWKTAIPRCSTLNPLKDDFEDYEGDYNLFAGNFFRRPIWNQEMGDFLHFHSVMSYWGQQLGDSSWTINTRPKNPWYQQVLLDPPNSYTIASNRECMYDFLTAVLHEDISKAWSKLTVHRRSKEYGSDDSESETSDSESDYTSSESGTSERGSEYANSESEISNRESDDKGSKRNWLRFLRRQRKGATVDEEKATESHSIRERSFQTAESDSIISADNRPFEITRLFSIRSEDRSSKTAKTNSLAVREGSSIVSKDPMTKKRNTL
ncbi:uncharacterized protein EAF02_008061 [Botrytis sinoallii]|uniref:uncharacterized protein n=1 Tax=Botrytis sinoallii TaxID=1463999 RepID=UPI001901BA0E|nr:uncharacterized protein EAF02_008061 [Botrytis sinoallii]KAF7876841.1 hypothetical protein EAF02_008061 [Botrytis sinoallii]